VRLEEHLGAIYRERVVLGGDASTGASAALAATLAADPAMRAAAESRLAELRDLPADRCFISAQHRRYLEAALAFNPVLRQAHPSTSAQE
jgi:hypothetical protein